VDKKEEKGWKIDGRREKRHRGKKPVDRYQRFNGSKGKWTEKENINETSVCWEKRGGGAAGLKGGSPLGEIISGSWQGKQENSVKKRGRRGDTCSATPKPTEGKEKGMEKKGQKLSYPKTVFYSGAP